METMNTLNVTALEPRLKHPKIFEMYDGLNPGQAFVIENDHDPKPLYYQFLAERGQTFSWDYLENGPEIWKVKIAKKEAQANEETIGEIVTKDYRKAQVFKRFGIDFCCGGKKTVSEVCEKKGIDALEVQGALALLTGETSTTENDYLRWDIGFLTDFIINTHHQYVKENTPFIMELANKVAKVHGGQHPETLRIAQIFCQVGADLMLHMSKEERILFPFIKELVAVQHQGGSVPTSAFGKVSNPIQMMESEHEQAGEALQTIREITNNFTLPPDACNSYTILYKKLDEYENDLHRHVHLENNVLFPKAIAVEKALQVAAG
ncbi:iron-sulfur cluster repair di-iron protein [Pedobacter nyackensis]|uniref:Regulator of cell morphogenesis and NO signaling n=1 Tax=Pedobacter nyackensis TaxID=475255 RepID=A0A1W2DWC0_9SPHI|nr:iron-sulfur cluster repair di-iron protein [Pedobacter nyackensis]SMD01627.1 regulator of cell morphogenesis and NO signaling [Pedobacter nyackensis]